MSIPAVRQRVLLGALVVLAIGAGGLQTAACVRPPDVLNRSLLQTPRFSRRPTPERTAVALRQMYQDLHGPNGVIFRQRIAPNQAGVLWIGLLVGIFVAADLDRLRQPRNIDLLLLLAVGILFFEILRFFKYLQDPTYLRLLDWVFTAIVALSAALLVRAVLRARRPLDDAWEPGPSLRTLATVGLLLLALNFYVGLARAPDDAGFYVNLGAQRLRERGLLPYGDPLLTSTPAAAYGPILYAIHIPFQILLAPAGVNEASPDLPLEPGTLPYYLPPMLATQLCTLMFHLAGVVALFLAARRLRNARIAWAMVALYCGSAGVVGVGSEADLVGGMTFVSHIAPAATVLIAFALLHRPAWSGAMLAVGIGVLFYPVFLVPAWAGYYWNDRQHLRRFAAGLLTVSVLIGGSVLFLSRPADGRGLFGTVLHDTLGHQEDPDGYGSSPFGFWGGREGVRGWFMQPMLGGVPTSRPIVLIFLVFTAGTFFLARGRRPSELALLIGAVAIGAQLWKIHGTGTYVTWYYPFLLLGFFAAPERHVSECANEDTHVTRTRAPAQQRDSGTLQPAARTALVIGAGPAGLTGAYELVERGVAVTVLEQDPQVGGIARTVEYKGFRFDIGGHRFFTKVPYVQALWRRMLGGDMLSRPRLSRIHYRGRFFDYPLRPANALLGLGIGNAALIAASYAWSQLRPIRPEVSFEDWVTNRFGRRLYRIFFKTYTEKVWGIPCHTIGAQWAAQRIRGLSLWTAVRSMFTGSDDRIKTLIDRFEYPRLGPGMMWERFRAEVVARGGVVELDSSVRRLSHDERLIRSVEYVRGGATEERAVELLLSTMPLRTLVEALDPPAPAYVREAASRLKYRDFLTVALIVANPDVFPDNWIYVHDPHVKLGRIQNFKNWSPEMVPDPSKTCLGLEYFCFEGDGLWTMSDEALIELGRREAAAIGLIEPEQVLDGAVVRMPKAYPVYDEGYDEAVILVRDYLAGFENLQVAGRNGLHKYNNQDHSMVTAMLAARNLLGEQHDVWAVNSDEEYHEQTRREDEVSSLRRALNATQPAVPR